MMEKATHTPGPWRPGKDGQSIVCDTPISSRVIGTDHIEHYGGHVVAETVTPNNQDRIIACVNACEGINPGAVKDLLVAAKICGCFKVRHGERLDPTPCGECVMCRAIKATEEGV